MSTKSDLDALAEMLYHPAHLPEPPIKSGWQCPLCGQVYAPFVVECLKCNQTNLCDHEGVYPNP